MRLKVLGVAVISCSILSAQVDSRADSIEQSRRARVSVLKPDELSGPERLLRWASDEKILARISTGFNGLRVKFGGMVTGGGFGLGPEYFREDLLDGQFKFRAAAQTSFSGFRRYEVQADFPRLSRNRVFASLLAARHDYPDLRYYGPGPDSKESGGAHFRFEDVTGDGLFGLRPVKPLRFGASAGYARFNTGRSGRELPSVEQIYQPSQAPGIDLQTDYWRYGPFVELDYRDDPAGPRNGGKYLVQYTVYDARRRPQYSFRRMDIDLEQYIGLFNRRRVFALRARGVLTNTGAGRVVPFYLQPDLGGSDDLRGFRPFRFRDDNLLVMNAEYRWEVFSGLDMAAFADAGKVFAKRSQLNFHDLESSVGFGLRFNVQNRTFLRLDVGFSHEGVRLWFKFNDVFNSRRLGTAGTHPVP